MADGTFTFRVDDELKAAFAEVAASQERTAAPLPATFRWVAALVCGT